MKPQFIVAEISKNWSDGREMAPTGLVSTQFEQVIEVNRRRGYRLHSFQLHRMMTTAAQGPVLNETVMAVFELEG
jgi:hypothetical protein